MKKLLLIAACSLCAINLSAQAATVGQAFNVTATLSAQCVSHNTSPADVNFGLYTAFGGPATTAPTTAIGFRCTKGLAAPSVALSTSSGTILGLAYTLAVPAAPIKTTSSGAATTSGTYDVYTSTVTGTMVSGQAGDTAGTAGPVAHTLTLTY